MTALAGRTERIHWRYVLAGLCLAGLGVFQSYSGSAVWAMVFGLAALGNAYLCVRPILPPRFGGEAGLEVQRSSSIATLARPLPDAMSRSLDVYAVRVRSWLVIAAIGWMVTVGVILLIPPFSLAGGVLSMFATHRYLRCRRSVKILRRALAADKTPKDASDQGAR